MAAIYRNLSVSETAADFRPSGHRDLKQKTCCFKTKVKRSQAVCWDFHGFYLQADINYLNLFLLHTDFCMMLSVTVRISSSFVPCPAS